MIDWISEPEQYRNTRTGSYLYTEIPKNPKYPKTRNTRPEPERVSERPPLRPRARWSVLAYDRDLIQTDPLLDVTRFASAKNCLLLD
ncbi:hypothetical protein YC2023_099733 [Brassica napus]